MQPGPQEDDQLIEAARGGDASAFEALVERYQDLAFRAAYLVTGDAAEAQDAAQEAFIKAYYALPRFRAGASFRPWFLTIVTNESRNRRKAAARRGGLALKLAPGPEEGVPSPEQQALLQEQRTMLLATVNGLREEERLAVVYRYFLELTEEEMAQALHCPRGTVKSRLSRALGRIRERLAGELGTVGDAADIPSPSGRGSG